MMRESWKEREHHLLKRFKGNPPATAAAVGRFKTESGLQLPEDYLLFLQQANGGEGFIGAKTYLILWPLEQLVEMNNSYRVSEYAAGLFVFGSDGGGEAFAFDTRTAEMPIVSVPFVGMDLEAIRPQALTFTAFLERLFTS